MNFLNAKHQTASMVGLFFFVLLAEPTIDAILEYFFC